MFPGLGNMDPKKMKGLLNQFGIKTEEVPANRVVIESDGKNIVIDNPQVTAMNLQGKKTFTVMGDAHEEASENSSEDLKLLVEQTGLGEDEAKELLKKHEGDLAEALQEFQHSK